MNKLIVGGILVTVMGGTPTATYFLTQKEEASAKSEPREEVRASDGQGSDTDISKQGGSGSDQLSKSTAECQPKESTNTCPKGITV